MPTPNPALAAAAPILISALTDVKQAVATILTGDAAQIGLRVTPAVQILEGQLTLLLPELANAEEPAILSDVTGGLDGLISKLQAIAASAKDSAPAADAK